MSEEPALANEMTKRPILQCTNEIGSWLSVFLVLNLGSQ